MTKHNWQRLLQHFPIGGLASWLTTQNASLGLGLLFSSFVYEAFNDWRKKDASYHDVLGIVWGFGIISLALAVCRLF